MGVSGGVGYEGVYTSEGGAGADPENVTRTTAPGKTGDAATANGGVSLSNSSYYTKETVLSSITSGGPLNIDVAGHTDITGALIASIDAHGKDTGQLTLNTGSLSFTDLKNTHQSSDSTVALNSYVLLNEDKTPEKGTTNQPQDSKGEDQPSGTTNLGIHQNSSQSAGKTLATIGNGSITVGGEATEPEGLNRDVEEVEKELYAIDRVKGDFDLTVENKTIEEVADQVSELLEKIANSPTQNWNLTPEQVEAMKEIIQKGKASGDKEKIEIAKGLEADLGQLALYKSQQQSSEYEPQLAGAPTLSGKSFEELKNEFSAVDGALNNWYTGIQQGGEQSYQDGVYRGEVSAYAYNSAPAFGSETDYSGATAFYQAQREAAYASKGLNVWAPEAGALDYVGWATAGFVNESWQGAQFIGKASVTNPALAYILLNSVPSHSLIGENTLFGTPATFGGAVAADVGQVFSYFAGIEGLAVLGLKGTKYLGKTDEVPEFKSSLDKNLFDAGGESDFYNKVDNAGNVLPATGNAANAATYAKLKLDLKTTQAANEVVESLQTTGKLPSNYVDKAQAAQQGWQPGKALNNSVPGGQLGGDVFNNVPPVIGLPQSANRTWQEVDIGLSNTMSRNNQLGTRLLYSNDGLLFITTDHYKTVAPIGTWKK